MYKKYRSLFSIHFKCFKPICLYYKNSSMANRFFCPFLIDIVKAFNEIMVLVAITFSSIFSLNEQLNRSTFVAKSNLIKLLHNCNAYLLFTFHGYGALAFANFCWWPSLTIVNCHLFLEFVACFITYLLTWCLMVYMYIFYLFLNWNFFCLNFPKLLHITQTRNAFAHTSSSLSMLRSYDIKRCLRFHLKTNYWLIDFLKS